MGKNFSKKVFSFAIAMIMVLSAAIVPMTGIVASASTNDTLATATELTFGTVCSETITDTDKQDYFKFVLPDSGKLNFEFKADGIPGAYANIYDDNGALIWSGYNANSYGDKYITWDSTTKRSVYTASLDYTAGTYYLYILQREGTGSYTVKIDYTSAEETFKESGLGKDNTLATANNISFDKNYKGQIASNDTEDYYKFVIPASGKVDFNFKADAISGIYVRLYDENGAERFIYHNANSYGDKYITWNGTTQKIVYDCSVDITAGTYYLYFAKRNETGNYNFTIKFTSAKESFKETGMGTNNTIATANQVNINQTYLGQIAINDGVDYYSFDISESKKLNVVLKAENIDSIYLRIYDKDGSWVWDGYNKNSYGDKYVVWDGTTQKIDYQGTVDLSAGTFYLFICQKGGTGNFSFSVSEEGVTPAEPVIPDEPDIPDVPDIPDTPVVTTFTLTYDANGGSGAPAAQTGASEYTISSTVPVRSGYKFLGWAFDKNATSAACTGGANITLTSDTVLYAVWEKIEVPVVKTYTLSYDANGGTGAPAAQTGASEYKISTTIPVRDGYKFLGWAFDKNATSAACTGGANIALTSDTVLYAVWQKVETPPVVTTYTLSYNANGGSGAPAAQTGSTSYTVSSTVPVRNGYKFLGWSTSASATTASYTAGKTITLTKNTTLYAVWQVIATEPGKYVCPYCGEKFGEEDKYEEHYEEEIVSRNIAVVFQNPSRTLIEYGDAIILHVDTYNLPAGSTIKWSVNNGNFAIVAYSADGKSCTITPNATGDTVITATVYDAEGREICSDSQMMSAKAGIWQKIVAFFKKLFGLNETFPALFKVR